MFDVKKDVNDVHEHSHFETLGGETQENFKCRICKQIVKTRKNLLRHIREQHKEKMFHCSQCSYKTGRRYLLSKHEKKHILKVKETNGRNFENAISSVDQYSTSNEDEEGNETADGVRTAFRGKLQERVWNIRQYTDPHIALNKFKVRIRDAITLSLKRNPQKFYIAIKVKFFKRDKDGNKIEQIAYFHGSMHTLLRKEEFEESFQSSLRKIMKAYDEFLIRLNKFS